MTDEPQDLKNTLGQSVPLSDELGWISAKNKLHPDKPGLKLYEQVACLVVCKG